MWARGLLNGVRSCGRAGLLNHLGLDPPAGRADRGLRQLGGCCRAAPGPGPWLSPWPCSAPPPTSCSSPTTRSGRCFSSPWTSSSSGRSPPTVATSTTPQSERGAGPAPRPAGARGLASGWRLRLRRNAVAAVQLVGTLGLEQSTIASRYSNAAWWTSMAFALSRNRDSKPNASASQVSTARTSR